MNARFAAPALVTALVVGATALTMATMAAPASATSAAATSKSVTIRLLAGHTTRDRNGKVWHSDGRYATGGHVVRTSRSLVSGRSNKRLFDRVRVGHFAYRVPVGAGTYSVKVSTVAGAHRGNFSVRVNGQRQGASLDVMGRKGLVRSYAASVPASIRGRYLTITFSGRKGASVAGITITGRRWLPPIVPLPPVVNPVPAPGPTSPPPSTEPPVGDNTVSVDSFGAKGDGVTDDTAALQRAFDNADGRTVILRSGAVYLHSAVLELRTPGLRVHGDATLMATNEATSSVWLFANNVTLDGGVTVATQNTTKRWVAYEQMGVRLGTFSGLTLRDVNIVGSAAAGVYVGGASNFVIDHVTVKDTRADGIHMTEGAHDGQVIDPTITNSGDDGVAVVSYSRDGAAPDHDITITSPRVYGTSWGRGLSVVGGNNITYKDIYVADTSAAAVYVAAEGDPFWTYAPSNVLVEGGTIVRANKTASVEHGAVLVMSGEDNVAPNNVTIRDLAIANTVDPVRNIGVTSYGMAPSNVLFQNISISGGGRWMFGGNAPQSSYKLRSVSMGGAMQADRG